MSDAQTSSAAEFEHTSKLSKYKDMCGFEFHAIIVKSLPENRKFDTIKLFRLSNELIYLRPKIVSLPENHRLLLRGPKVGVFGSDESSIHIGERDWNWTVVFDRDSCPRDGLQSVVVEDPQFPDAAVEIIFEKIPKPAQAHFKIRFVDDMNKDLKIKILRGEIWATSNGNQHIKRLIRCFGDDLTNHMIPAEEPKSKKFRAGPTELLSGEAIGLYKSHMILPAESVLNIGLNLELQIEFGTGVNVNTYSVSFNDEASFTAPASPKWLENKELISFATKSTKVAHNLKIDDFASIQVEISWFNDGTACVPKNMETTLWGYRDDDCDYKGIGLEWADKQELNLDQWLKELKELDEIDFEQTEVEPWS